MKNLDDSLRELARDIPPARDLWPDIAAQLAVETTAAKPVPRRVRWGSIAASVALAALIGVSLWMARGPVPHDAVVPRVLASVQPTALQALGPDYVRNRERLLNAFPRQLAGLPPESRAKVAASLSDIHKALQDIDAALAQDSGSALLQELLINTCQDEMRVLMAVQEAGAAGGTV